MKHVKRNITFNKTKIKIMWMMTPTILCKFKYTKSNTYVVLQMQIQMKME